MADKVPWLGSDRASRLPPDWPERRAKALGSNPMRICHWCGLPGGTDLDHKDGDWTNDDQDNLDFIHSRRDVVAGRSKVNCHGIKTSREGNAVRHRREPPMKHPGLL